MLQYIVAGKKPDKPNMDIEAIDNVVKKVKSRKEVTNEYMRQCDKEHIIKREVKMEAALEMIRFGREEKISDDKIRKRIERLGLDTDMIDELFKQVDEEEKASLVQQ